MLSCIGSPPCASVLMIAEALNLKLNLIAVDIEAQEQFTPEFLKLNPEHTLPTLVDNGFILWESRAICHYLVEKYGKDNSIYPSDAKARGVITQRLYFDFLLYERFADYYYAPYFKRKGTPEELKKFEDNVAMLDKLLAPSEFFAGTKSFSIADVFLYSTVSCFQPAGIDISPYSNVTKWLAKIMEIVPGREIMRGQLEAFSPFMASLK